MKQRANYKHAMHGLSHHGEDDHDSDDDIDQKCQDGSCNCNWEKNSNCSAVFGDHASHDGEERGNISAHGTDITDVVPMHQIIAEINDKISLLDKTTPEDTRVPRRKSLASSEKTTHEVSATVEFKRNLQPTSTFDDKPRTSVMLDKGKDGEPRFTLAFNKARQRQMNEEDTEFEEDDEDFFEDCNPRNLDIDYTTPTKEDYDHSSLPIVSVNGALVKDFRHGEGRNKCLGRRLPRYKHALRTARKEKKIIMPAVFDKVWDKSQYIECDTEDDDTASEDSDVSIEVN